MQTQQVKEDLSKLARIRKLRRRSVLWWKTLPFSNRTTHDHEKAKLLSLDPILFEQHRPAIGCVQTTKVIYKSLGVYCQRLQYINYLLSIGQAVPNSWCRYEWTQTTLNSLWVNEKGIHEDAVASVTAFKSLSLTFLDQYEQIKDQQVDIEGHNALLS